MIAIYTGASAAELEEALEGRRKGMLTFALNLETHLRPGLSVDQAAAVLQALCLPEVYHELVQHSAWSPDDYQAWLAQALKRELLGKAG